MAGASRRPPRIFAWGTTVGLVVPWLVSLWVARSAQGAYSPLTAGPYGVAIPTLVRGLWAAAAAGALLSLAAVVIGALSSGLRRWQGLALCLLALATLAANARYLAALVVLR